MRHGVMLSALAGALMPALILAGPVISLFGIAVFGMVAAIGSEDLRSTLAGCLILTLSGILVMYSPVFVEEMASQVSSLFLGGLVFFSAGSFGAMKTLFRIESREIHDADINVPFDTSLENLHQVA